MQEVEECEEEPSVKALNRRACARKAGPLRNKLLMSQTHLLGNFKYP